MHSDTNLIEMKIKYSLREKGYVCIFALLSNLTQSYKILYVQAKIIH